MRIACAPGRSSRRGRAPPAQHSPSAADGIAEYRKMLEDGNPAELFEAKGEDLWKHKRGPEERVARAVRPGQGPGRGQGRVRRAAALLRRHPARCRTWSRGCSPAWRRCRASTPPRSPRRRSAAASRPTWTALVAWVAAESRGHAASTCRRPMPKRRTMFELGKRAVLLCAPARTTSPAPPATAKTASASACRTCPTSPRTRATASASRPGRPTACPTASCGACSGA